MEAIAARILCSPDNIAVRRYRAGSRNRLKQFRRISRIDVEDEAAARPRARTRCNARINALQKGLLARTKHAGGLDGLRGKRNQPEKDYEIGQEPTH
jgi:hypothetical protein